MVGRSVALLVATDRYQDTGLSRLAAPASDAEQLAAVLRDIRIAGFDVTTLYNEPHYVVGRAIGDFYRERRGNDLTLLYFTGHGVKDEDGRLYLAMTDTDRENLAFTGVSSEQIRAAMEGSRSRQKVLVLDCCYAGAFPAGLGIKGDPSVHALEQLGGRGCVVLTSSDAMQLSFEGNQVTETGPVSLRSGPSSLFTRFLIKGLRTGKADLDGDGDITLDELYSYVHDRVIDEQPLQRPKKKEDIEGRIYFAQNIYWTVPSRISDAINSPYPPGKLSALDELRSLHYRGNVIVKQRVLETVRLLAGDDSKSVSGAASQFLSELNLQEEGRQAEEAAGREAEEETARRQAEEAARRQAEEETARRQAEEETARRQAEEETARRQAEEAARRQAEEETARRQAEEAARRQAEEETARRQAEEAARRQAEEETARRQAIRAEAEVPAAVLVTEPDSLEGEAGDNDESLAPMATVVAAPPAPPSRRDIVHRPGATTVRGRRHRRRLAALALGGAIIAAVGVISFMLLNSAVKSQGPLSSPSVAKSTSPANSPSPVTSPQFRPVPSGYSGSYISSLAFSPSGATLAIADNRRICLWDIAAKRCTSYLPTSAWSVAFSPNGKLLAAVHADGSGANIISLWNPATPQPTPVLLRNPNSQGTYSVAWGPDNETLAAADVNGTTYLWNVVTHKLIAPPLPGPQGQPASSVAFSGDGKLLAVGYENGSTAYLFNVVTHKLIARLPGPQGQSATSVAFSRDGTLLAVGYENGRTYLWSAVTQQLIARFGDSSGQSAYSVAFSPDSRLLAVGDTNGSIYVFDVAARELLRTLGEPNSGPVDSVVFSPRGGILAAGYGHGSVYLWYISLRLSIVRICCQVCSPSSSDRRFSSCRTRALRRAPRSCAASRSAWSDARVTA
jgi:DNA-binding beta-propeller fold protein YncE